LFQPRRWEMGWVESALPRYSRLVT
jgi:hypothetical protein